VSCEQTFTCGLNIDSDVILEALFSMQSNDSPPSQQSIPRGTRLISLSGVDLRDLARYVTIRASNSPRGINPGEEEEDEAEEEEEEDEEDEEEDQENYVSDCQLFPPVKEAQKEGEELLFSGDFGRVGIKIRSRANNGNLVNSVLNQATHLIPNLNKEDLLTVCFKLSLSES
jgi:WD repeat-containing protein 23